MYVEWGRKEVLQHDYSATVKFLLHRTYEARVQYWSFSKSISHGCHLGSICEQVSKTPFKVWGWSTLCLFFSMIFYLVSWHCCFCGWILSGAVMSLNWSAGKSHSNFDSLLEPDLPEIRDHRSFSSRHLSEEEQSDRIEKLESYVEQLEEEITALRKLKEELVEVKARSSFSSPCIHFYMHLFILLWESLFSTAVRIWATIGIETLIGTVLAWVSIGFSRSAFSKAESHVQQVSCTPIDLSTDISIPYHVSLFDESACSVMSR